MNAEMFEPRSVLLRALSTWNTREVDGCVWSEFASTCTNSKCVYQLVEYTLLEKKQSYVVALVILLWVIPKKLRLYNVEKLKGVLLSALKRKLPYVDYRQLHEREIVMILSPLSNENDSQLRNKILQMSIDDTQSMIGLMEQSKNTQILDKLVERKNQLETALK